MKFLYAILGLAVILGVVVAAGWFWWRWMLSPVASSGTGQDVRFVVPRGQAAEEIGRRLEEAGVIRSSLGFKLFLALTGRTLSIQAGEYKLSSMVGMSEIADQLLKGPEDVWVTIPEGWRKEQVALRLVSSLGLVGEGKQEFLAEFFVAAEEGYLFPDTYLVPKEASAVKVIAIMKQNFERKMSQEALLEKMQAEGRSLREIVTMAALIERETRAEAERPVVAGILWKRLKAGWPFQADAALQYVKASSTCAGRIELCPDWWPQIEASDKELVSPYNTYLNLGLPSGPIANPGLSSLRAAVFPEESEYWFYLHDSVGKIYYGRTIEEHGANINKYLK